MPSIRHFNDRNSSSSSRLLRSNSSSSVTHRRHPLQEELKPQLLRILSHQMQRSHYRPPSISIRTRNHVVNGLSSRFTTTLAPGLSSIQFLPEPLVGQLISKTLARLPVELMFSPRHNNPVLLVPSTIVESISLTITVPSGPVMGYKVSMIPKIEETIAEIWSSWLGISQDYSNINLSTIPESFLNQPVLPPMKILFWNCRGAGYASFLEAIRDIIHQHNPSILILMETVISGAGASRVIKQLGFSANFCLDPLGSSSGSGIWILWKMEDLQVHATSNSSHAIHAIIKLHPSKQSSWIPSSANESTSSQTTALGDLNETISSSEKSRGLLGHNHKWTSKREEQEELIRELFLKANVQQFLKAHPNFYYSMSQNSKRNTKAKKKKKDHEYQKYSSRSLLMRRLAKIMEGWKANEDWATPPIL